jgi:hypothetical protein
MNELHEPGEAYELTALREWDAGAAPLGDDARRRARARLFAAMNVPPAAGRTSPVLGRRPLLRLAVTAGAAAAVGTATLVVLREEQGNREAQAPPVMRTVSAVTVLRGAARHERAHEKVIAPRDDQFIYTKEIIKETERGTGATKSYVDENWRSVDGSKRSWVMEIGKGWWAPPLAKNETIWPPADWDSLKKLPTDPDKLILAVRTPDGPPRTQPKSVAQIDHDEWPNIQFALAGLLYRTPVMPSGLRAAAYEALAKVPGVTAAHGAKDALGRPGIAVSYEDPSQQWTWDTVFIFAEGSYEFLGFRSTRSSGDGAAAKHYTQLSYLDGFAVVDRAKQRP